MIRKTCLLLLLSITLSFMLAACRVIPEDNPDILPQISLQPPTEEIPVPSAEPSHINLIRTFTGHEDRVLDVSFTPDGMILASSGRDRKIRLWETSTGEELTSFQMHSVDLADIDISPNGELLASGEAIWDLQELEEIHTLERGSIHPTMVAFSPDSASLAVARFDQGVEIWNTTSGEIIQAFEIGDDTRTKRMEYSPDGSQLAAGVMDGTIRLYGTGSGEIVDTLHYPGETDIHDLSFSENGMFLAAVGRLPRVMIWDSSSWETLNLPPFRDNANALDFSPDGSLLAVSAGAERSVLVYELPSGKLIQRLPLPEQSLAMRFSPDGRYLVTGLFDGQILLWEISSQQE